ncbi:unnamed protein product [Meloidogyne enterolobii]|uniref:Uncharacterized protein n=1 Tax=Meloidogyne enterolobii TaxID=390850 RepID=A0ACB0ZFF1_MELEN
MEFLTLMIWGVEDGVPFIPEPAQPEPELVIADEETEPPTLAAMEENVTEAKEEQKVLFLFKKHN